MMQLFSRTSSTVTHRFSQTTLFNAQALLEKMRFVKANFSHISLPKNENKMLIFRLLDENLEKYIQLEQKLSEIILQVGHIEKMIEAFQLSDAQRQVLVINIQKNVAEKKNIINLLKAPNALISQFISENLSVLSSSEILILRKPELFRLWLIELIQNQSKHADYIHLFSKPLDNHLTKKSKFIAKMQNKILELQTSYEALIHQMIPLQEEIFALITTVKSKKLEPACSNSKDNDSSEWGQFVEIDSNFSI